MPEKPDQQKQFDFVFLDNDKKPFRAKSFRDDIWIHYLHADKKWVTIRRVQNQSEFWEIASRAITEHLKANYEFGVPFQGEWPKKPFQASKLEDDEEIKAYCEGIRAKACESPYLKDLYEGNLKKHGQELADCMLIGVLGAGFDSVCESAGYNFEAIVQQIGTHLKERQKTMKAEMN